MSWGNFYNTGSYPESKNQIWQWKCQSNSKKKENAEYNCGITILELPLSIMSQISKSVAEYKNPTLKT